MTSIEYLYGIFSQYGHKWRIMIFHVDSVESFRSNDKSVMITMYIIQIARGLMIIWICYRSSIMTDRDTVQPTEVTSIGIKC